MRRVLRFIAYVVLWNAALLSFHQAQAYQSDSWIRTVESAEPLSPPSVSVPELSTTERPSDHVSPQVPPQKARSVLEAVQKRHGEPLSGYVGGRTFRNRERKLPPGRYREYDVNPRIAGRNRGAERIVIEQRTGKAYYTGDHYVTFLPLN